ncbi:tRNA dihydrouridine(20/20a) synthase DusA [Paracoccus xiamenensis]|uniref:tRNA dihydrouridine(20/20a) synthase DusA n=1 Tax=Paracoccus xiamenensis TaxID=2714901 RepID=UPI0014099E4F|nr:tRNA dihydrouridine(20/20a) synthase DusA [Paracoccus xiamenensis]NHF73410.1 tRNA dihydrouridine(20/20a) synthase DusA [Paracoccus xiamenensis]
MSSKDTTAVRDAARLSVAPMMDWTDRYCRGFHRVLSRRALLFTEMVTAPAIIHGPRDRLLGKEMAEHPVALQIGGSDPDELARATALAAPHGYDEINLNVGCPSDRVQSGCFGAVLMKTPDLVARCVAAMIAESPVEVTVKCRIGVDDQDPETVLPDFLARMRDAGASRVTIHARKAWLEGLSPKDNREIPPLDYPLVHRMKAAFPDMHLSINGGVQPGMEAEQLAHMDGVMIGRAAYHQPWDSLGAADALWGDTPPFADPVDAALATRPLIARWLDDGARIHNISRHMLGLFHGRPGARLWRRTLSEGASKARTPAEGLALYDAALDQVRNAAEAA